MTKEAYLQYKLNENIVESTGLDLITMGRGQGPECYCYPNTVLKNFIENLAAGYKFVVMDNEAGMEHLSRKTTEDVDVLLLVSNHTVKGVRAIARIKELVIALKLNVKQQIVIVNNVQGKLDELVAQELAHLGFEADVIVPTDEELYRDDLAQKPLLTMSDNSPAVKAINKMMDDTLNPVPSLNRFN